MFALGAFPKDIRAIGAHHFPKPEKSLGFWPISGTGIPLILGLVCIMGTAALSAEISSKEQQSEFGSLSNSRPLSLRDLTLADQTGASLSVSENQAANGRELPIGLKDDELIVLIGGTLIEREQRYGYWEHTITTAHPEKKIRFRNLGWSGDTVWAESRGIFDEPEKGYQRLMEQVRVLKPSIILLHYGGNEAWAGKPGLERFLAQYEKLIGDLRSAAQSQQEDKPRGAGIRFVLLGPLPIESGVGPNKHPEHYNANVILYARAIARLAADQGIPFLDLAPIHEWHRQDPRQADHPLTDNGLHFSEYGYWRTAPWICQQLCDGISKPSIQLLATENHPGTQIHYDQKTGSFKVKEVPPQQQQKRTSVVRFRGRLTSLPRPVVTEKGLFPTEPSLAFLLTTPGTYRLEVDGKEGAIGDEKAWARGLPIHGAADGEQSRKLLSAIRKKNELYFHRWRPQNVTYLFLFRKHEQGNNASEILQFDPLVAEQEAAIAKWKIPAPRTFELIREPDRKQQSTAD